MHSLFDIYILFKISPATLHRWCQHARITPHIDPTDYRRRYLDNGQLLRLARLHNRVLVPDINNILLPVIERLEARVSKLEKERQDTP